MLTFGLFIAPPVITTILMFWHWFRAGKDPQASKVLVDQFEPSVNSNPIICDLILRGTSDQRSIGATVLQLCLSGHLTLYRQKVPFNPLIIEVAKPLDDLDAEQYQVCAIFFSELTVGQQSPLFCQNLQQGLDRTNQAQAIIGNAAQHAVELGFFNTNPINSQLIALGGYAFLGLLTVLLLICGSPVPVCLSAGQLVSNIIPPEILNILYWLLAGLTLAAIINIAVAKLMPKLTLTGSQTKDKLLGFRHYIQTATLPRIDKLQLPDNIPTLANLSSPQTEMLQFYEPSLPYAMLFFKDLPWNWYLSRIFRFPEEGEELKQKYDDFAAAWQKFTSSQSPT